MTEIYDPIEQAIIEALKKSNKWILPRKAIIKAVKNRLDKNDTIIIKRIDKLVKLKYVIKTSSRGIYELNRDFNFELVGQALPPISDSKEAPFEIRNKHTDDLKEAIDLWIRYFPKPCYDYCCLANISGINNFKNHPLFQDLQNHLPYLNSNLCAEWSNYKEEMKKIETMKKELYDLLDNEINKCFEGYLKFAPFFEYESIAGEYCDQKCDAIPCYIYYYVLELQLDGKERSSLLKELGAAQSRDEPDDAAYVEYDNAISAYRKGIVPKYNIFQYMGVNEHEAPEIEEEVDKLIKNFLTFFSAIRESRFMELGKNITININLPNQERDKMIKELERLLFYHSFPGDCEYLKASQ